MDRRHFLKSTAVAGGLALTPFNLNALAVTSKKYISDRVMLGNTNIEVSRLAIGTGTNG